MSLEEKSYQNLLENFNSSSKKDWIEITKISLKGNSINTLTSKSYDLDIKPIYTSEDLIDSGYDTNELPGAPPYLRGIKAIGYKQNSWFISQEIDASTPKKFNQKAKHSIKNGQTAIKVLIKTDNNDSGLLLNTLEDLSVILDGIDISKIPINFDAKENSLKITKLISEYIKINIIQNALIGIDYDIYRIALETSSKSFSFDKNFINMYEILDHQSILSEKSFLIGINSSPYKEGGCNIIQELAFSIATGTDYIRKILQKGSEINNICNAIRFTFSTGSDFFMEIAKLRAARILWSKIVSEFGGNSESQKMNLYIHSSKTNKSHLDHYVNILRSTTESLSSILGGCDSLQIDRFDEDINPTNELSERISRNTQIVLKDECNLTEVIDPAGGSYYVETLTKELAQSAWDIFKEIEKKGGMLNALKIGFPQEEIKKIVDEKIKNFSIRKDIILGANKYANLNDNCYFDPKIKNSHDSISYPSAIKQIQKFRVAELFEELRNKAEIFKQKNGKFPQVFLAAFGTAKQHKARVEFAIDFFHVGGFETIYHGEFKNIEKTVKSFNNSNSRIIVVCSSDDIYPAIVPKLTEKIKKVKPNTKVIIAGYPKDNIKEFTLLGVDEFIHIKANIVEILNRMFKSFVE